MATVDLPSVWNQGAHYRPTHHYDGNTMDSRARNIGAIIGVGGDPLSVRFRNVKRVADWLDEELHAPEYPWRDQIDSGAVQQGKEVYDEKCSGCHGTYDQNYRLKAPTRCMQKATSDLAGTDSHRARAVDGFLVDKLNELGRDKGVWEIDSFKATQAYLCPPLDGIWARAPYLHNGSVPTLDQLLSGERVETFGRGDPRYDQEHGGFVYTASDPDPERPSFEFDTREPGNSARGHAGERQLVRDSAQRHNLIQYLYKL